MASSAAAGSVSCIVWEWQRRDGGFSPFPPHDSASIEAAHRAKSATCRVGRSTVDLTNLKLTKTRSRHDSAIRRSSAVLPGSPPILAYWSWDEGGQNYALYSIEAVVDIELQYQRAHWSSVDLSKCSSRLPYTVDFSRMQQTRHGYGTKRDVRRDPVPSSQSLQALLQQRPGPSHPPSVSGSGGGFSLATGPATHILNSQAGGPTGAAVSASHRPTASPRRGRRANKHSASSSPPLGRGGKSEAGGTQVPEYALFVKSLQSSDDGPCPICMCQLSQQSGYEEEGGGGGGVVEMPRVPYAPPVDLCKLRKCGHMMHRACLLMMLKSESAKNGLTCPTCKKVYGIKTGDMPDGSMTVRNTRGSLPGHEGHGTIEIVYNFSPGVHNGRSYRANGFPRTCYLPNTEKGQKVLRLLKVAWERRLTFTIATSVTTGATDTVVWNEIHHKTESSSNHSGHGYPDPNYLDNVLMELSLQGVTESDSDSTSDDSL